MDSGIKLQRLSMFAIILPHLEETPNMWLYGDIHLEPKVPVCLHIHHVFEVKVNFHILIKQLYDILDLFVAVIQLSGSGFNQSFSNRTIDGSRALVVAVNCGKHFKHSKALKKCLRSKSVRKIQDAALYIVSIH